MIKEMKLLQNEFVKNIKANKVEQSCFWQIAIDKYKNWISQFSSYHNWNTYNNQSVFLPLTYPKEVEPESISFLISISIEIKGYY